MFRKASFSVSSILFNSDLNFDMESTFRIVSFKHIAADTSSRCGVALEILKLFFLDCPKYLEARTTLIGHLNMATTAML
jgi:hypothetical protein